MASKAQKIDSMYVNLYTDSLKKGRYNYINIDGLLSNGNYIPLDSNHIIFSSSCGKFYGNNLWIDSSVVNGEVSINVMLRKDTTVYKNFVLFVKTKEEEKLKTAQQIMDEIKRKQKNKRKSLHRLPPATM